MDNTYQNRLKCIDTVLASNNILCFVKGSKLCEINEILDIDYQRYVIDMNFGTYFEEEFSNWNNTNKSILDPGKRAYRKRFRELIDKILDTINIKNELERLSSRYASK